jgi:hypothetical protein
MVTSTYAKIVSVKIERGASGAYFATSPDLEGFMAVSPDRNELEQKLIPQYLADLYKAAGQPVVVSRVESRSGDDDGQPWVAFPLETARQAIAASS